MTDIILNGAPFQVAGTASLTLLVAQLDLGQQAIAVAVNRRIVPRSAWAAQLLQPGDQVDVVRAIGGG